MIERFWRSSYECVYLHAFGERLRGESRIGKWLAYYNAGAPSLHPWHLTP
jgi:hypothetical protein